MKKKYMMCTATFNREECDGAHLDPNHENHCTFHQRRELCSNCCRGKGPCIEIELTDKEYKGYILRWKVEGKL
jgi:hypothetical protein